MLHGSLKAFQRAGGARRAGVAARPLLGIFAAIGPMPLHVAAAPAGLDKALFATVAAPITPAFAAMAPVVSVSSRSFSIIGDIREKISGKMEEKKEEMQSNQFVESLKRMNAGGELTMQRFYELQKEMLDQASGWKAKAASAMGQSIDTALIEKNVKIFEALTPAERATFKRSGNVTFMIKQRIMFSTKVGAEEVNLALRRYDEMLMVQRWVAKRTKKGLPLPTSPVDMQRLMAIDPPEMPESMKPKQPRRR